MYVIRVISLASDSDRTFPFSGQYLKSFDVEFHGGDGSATFTDKMTEAHQFESLTQALATWQSVPECKPLRSDGKPNRPLTTFTVEIVNVVHASEEDQRRGIG